MGKRVRTLLGPRAETSWEHVARWYDSVLGEGGSRYHQEVIIPDALRLLNVKQNDRVLDLACGVGVFCRALHKQGARVTGVDASEELVRLAREKSPRAIHYEVADARHMDRFNTNSLDAISCILAIQNMDPIEAIFSECARLIRPGGHLLLVMTHPCFRVPRQSGWGWDEQRQLLYRRIDHYLTPLKVPIQMHPGSAPHITTWTFHRPLSTYVSELTRKGFVVNALEEWPSNRVSKPGPRAKAEDSARREIPLFLALRAVRT